MRIVTLKDNFTKDLESFVKNPMQIPCLTEWNPKRVAAPERHISLGKDINLTLDIQIYTLEKENVALDNIASLLRIYLDRTVLRSMPRIDPVKEQVWLFAQKWFAEYYEILTEPDILKSEFFRSHHDDFLALLGKMLDVNPKKRISFLQALKEWTPANPLFETKEDTPVFIQITSQATTSETASSSLPVSSVSSLVSWTPLVLNGCRHSEEHNKTRKNLRN